MASLQDQLLKAGLTTKQKTRQANSDKRKKNKQQRSGVEHGASLQEQVKQDLAISKADKLAKDTALNEAKKIELAKKEQNLRIKQILEHHQLTGVKGESDYNYTFNNKVKKLALNSITHKALVNGRLALCGLNESTYLVTSETAAKVAELDSSMILVQNDKVTVEETDEDDPYADYQIPDDLMW
ncbi:DUF2058 domain-containing protein [Colwellia psychrerythraea]|uniref:Nucleoprotein/polynucleotide-associated enzyme n=1 Tax=Colwellia psychrerythraea TaxID=28229 RepID=A0A099L269_COLPS|nr:DUF2058 domain-containing protein [Colwellia psychrerythraea]KGJ96232.1 Protein of unknown function DUF2058 [Colwellia psychrerythraea]